MKNMWSVLASSRADNLRAEASTRRGKSKRIRGLSGRVQRHNGNARRQGRGESRARHRERVLKLGNRRKGPAGKRGHRVVAGREIKGRGVGRRLLVKPNIIIHLDDEAAQGISGGGTVLVEVPKVGRINGVAGQEAGRERGDATRMKF